MSKPIAIYPGYAIRYPLGGHLVCELQSLIGLQRLGYDVFYVEESGQDWAPCFDPTRNDMTRDPSYGIGLWRELLRSHGLEHQWCYVDSDRQYHGLTAVQLRDLCRRSTVLFNRASVNWLEEFRECRTRVYIDLDPMYTQARLPAPTAPSMSGYASPYEFQFHFSCGERLGQPDCPIPTGSLHWRRTRIPVVLDLIEPQFTPDATRFTTVMNWRSYEPVEYRGEFYGQKCEEMLKIIDLPRRAAAVFEVALSGVNAPLDQLQGAGWIISSAHEATRTVAAYREFINQSRGEFSVAKHGYVKSRSGVFLDRSLTYLATGKPVILQDTGFSELLPCGEGLFAWRTMDDIVTAVETINRDYAKHCRAARRVAAECFDSDKVLGALLRECDLPYRPAS